MGSHEEVDAFPHDDAEDEFVSAADFDLDAIESALQKFQADGTVRDALELSVDFRGYAEKVDHDLRQVEKESIQDYINESDNLATLHEQIHTCDGILEKMETMLSTFQDNLGSVSQEIRSLQEKSLSMNQKLKNRRAVESAVSSFVSRIVVPPELVRRICDADIDVNYVEALAELNAKLENVNSESQRGSCAAQEMRPELEKLRFRAVSRAREFLLSTIHLLKKPKTNIQILQQSKLHKYSDLNKFLYANAPEVFEEVRSVYYETMSKIVTTLLRTYSSNVHKLTKECAGRYDLIGLSPAQQQQQQRSLFGSKNTVADADAEVTPYIIGDRRKILEQLDAPHIIYHVASQRKEKFAYEEIFRSTHHLLTESVTSEFFFVSDFFGCAIKPPAVMEIFHAIFDKTIAGIEENTIRWIENTHDALTVLLVIRVLHQQQLTLSKRRVPCLDAHMDKLRLHLWPKFKSILDMHIKSLAKADDPKICVRRFAEFSASIALLNVGYNENMVDRSLRQMLGEVEKLVERFSTSLKTRKQQSMQKITFLQTIVETWKARGLESADLFFEIERMLQDQIGAFVDTELDDSFCGIVSFTSGMEKQMGITRSSSDQLPELSEQEMRNKIDINALSNLVKEFSARWKRGIDELNRSISQQFGGSTAAQLALKQALSRLLQTYSRVLDIVKRCGDIGLTSRDVVTTPTIMYEIKRLQKN